MEQDVKFNSRTSLALKLIPLQQSVFPSQFIWWAQRRLKEDFATKLLSLWNLEFLQSKNIGNIFWVSSSLTDLLIIPKH